MFVLTRFSHRRVVQGANVATFSIGEPQPGQMQAMDKTHRMSRLSVHPRLGPRDSIFPGNPDLHRAVDSSATCSPYLRECVMAMEDCCDEAYEAQELIRQGTYDLPRMTKVLDSDRVFLLVDEGKIRRYTADLSDEIEPQINELLSRAEKGLEVLLKKESLLQAKVEAAQSRSSSRTAVNTVGMNKLDMRRMQMLARQRQKLEDGLATLQAEVDAMVILPNPFPLCPLLVTKIAFQELAAMKK
ncbi:Spc19-domain-containing protein [Daedaleopsis nitida]|nr:Spc19-domain-containing protein [Daedaleopsis nitida]